mmetsp:Transcript_23733/g.50800  ORF Transcript_23733/g.50800 Transcript_23733/m.50800 type:complete len:558 (+) Transcript_23733:106-1779(+)
MELQATTCTDGIVVVLDKGSNKEQTTRTAPPAVPPSSENGAAMAKSPASMASIRNILNLSFPRCSCCETGWYDAIAAGNDDEDDGPDSAAGKRKSRRHRPSHFNLFPMPKCGCTTRLALPHLPPDILSPDDCEDPSEVLSRIKTHSFPNLAICKPCLEIRIAVSKEVVVHDYRQEGQRNVKFTVEADCIQCRRKFMGRVLEKLLNSGGGPKNNDSRRNGRKGNPDANWWDAVEATIKFVGWAKRERRRERRRMSQRRRAEKKFNPGKEPTRNDQNKSWWANHNELARGDDDCSSDGCYSLSSYSCDEWQSDDESRPKGPHRVQLKSGELMQELLQKDPKFRQEREDEQYAKIVVEEEKEQIAGIKIRQEKEDEEYVKRVMEEEEERKRAAEARACEDHELAMKLQEALDKKNSKPEVKSPIIEALKRSSDKKPGGKQSPSANEAKRRKRGHQLGSDSRSVASAHTLSAKLSPGEIAPASSQSPVRTAHSLITAASEQQSSSYNTNLINDASNNNRAIDEVVAMGFREDTARRCLKDANGNIQLAVSMLLSEAAEADG